MQTALVLHLDALNGVANRASFIQLAAEQRASEGEALFFSETSRILAQLHTGGRTLLRLAVLDSLPVALAADGNVVVALEWDYASWTQNAANFIAQLKAAKVRRPCPGWPHHRAPRRRLADGPAETPGRRHQSRHAPRAGTAEMKTSPIAYPKK